MADSDSRVLLSDKSDKFDRVLLLEKLDKSENLEKSDKFDRMFLSENSENLDKPDNSDKSHVMILRSHKSVSSTVLSSASDKRPLSITDEGRSESSELSSLDDESSRCVIDSTIDSRVPPGREVSRSSSRMSSCLLYTSPSPRD